MFLGEQLLIGEAFDELDDLRMTRGQHLLYVTQWRVLVFLPDFRIQCWRGSPRVRCGQEWLGGPVLISVNEVEQHLLPRV